MADFGCGVGGYDAVLLSEVGREGGELEREGDAEWGGWEVGGWGLGGWGEVGGWGGGVVVGCDGYS